jgi:hypothetical protein
MAKAASMCADDAPGALQTQQFDFTSKLFAVPGARFARASDNTPILHVKVGDLEASLPFATVVASFQVSDHERQLLTLVTRGLRFVKEIRPGDTIPSEVLDGTASWAVDERHADTARKRLQVQLVGWFTGSPTDIRDTSHLLRIAEDPGVKDRVNDALAKAAVNLGLPAGDREGMLSRIESLVRELAYIEALRERFGGIHRIETMLDTLLHHFRGDVGTTQSIMRIKALLKAPFRRFQTIFDEIDAMTSEVLSALENVSNQVEFIRRARDELWDHYMAWQDVVEQASQTAAERSSACEVLVRKIYQLVASRYPQEQTWR